jgi:hypothetical protein
MKRDLEAVKRHGFKSLFPVTPTEMKRCLFFYANGAPAAAAAKKAGIPLRLSTCTANKIRFRAIFVRWSRG